VNILAVGKTQKKLDETISQIENSELKIVGKIADLSDVNVADSVISDCVQSLGGLNILINAAGVDAYSQDSSDKWEKCINVNLISLMKLTKCALPHIEKHSRGAVINIASDAGRETEHGMTPCNNILKQ
jgi:3-oxoacyl-[acyl-carrier protein] reductase